MHPDHPLRPAPHASHATRHKCVSASLALACGLFTTPPVLTLCGCRGGSIVAPLAHACDVHAAKQVHQPCTLASATVSRTASIWPPSQLPDDATTAVTIALLPSAGFLHRRPRCQRLLAASFVLHAASTITVVQVLWQTATPFAPLPWCNSIAFEACHYIIPMHS